jgi:hypothetical protein
VRAAKVKDMVALGITRPRPDQSSAALIQKKIPAEIHKNVMKAAKICKSNPISAYLLGPLQDEALFATPHRPINVVIRIKATSFLSSKIESGAIS